MLTLSHRSLCACSTRPLFQLGTHKRAKGKREELSNVLVEMRKADQASRAAAKDAASAE